LFIGLGDTDEWGHRDDYENYLRALRHADEFIGELLSTLDSSGEYGRSVTLVVTTDHGRADSFQEHRAHAEAARVWMAAVGGAVPRQGYVRSPSDRHLRDVAPTLRAWLALPPVAGARRGTVMTELLHDPAAS
jgi:phosphopentomutase